MKAEPNRLILQNLAVKLDLLIIIVLSSINKVKL